MICNIKSQDISDFLPHNFNRIPIEDLKELKYNSLKILDDYKKNNPQDSVNIIEVIKRLESIPNIEYIKSLNIERDTIKKLLMDIKGRKLNDLLDDLDSEFNKQELKYKLRFVARTEIGNNEQVVLNSLSPSLTFNFFYVVKENTKKQTLENNIIIDNSTPFWATVGMTLNLNAQSNSSNDTSTVISKILSYGADLNAYLTGKCGWNYKPLNFKFMLGLNGGFSYIRDKNIEPPAELAESTTKLSPSNLLFLNFNTGVWFFDIIMLGVKGGISHALGQESNNEKINKLTEFKGKLFTAIKIPVLNLGLILSYLWAPIEGIPSKERFQFKIVQSLDFGI